MKYFYRKQKDIHCFIIKPINSKEETETESFNTSDAWRWTYIKPQLNTLVMSKQMGPLDGHFKQKLLDVCPHREQKAGTQVDEATKHYSGRTTEEENLIANIILTAKKTRVIPDRLQYYFNSLTPKLP